MSLLVDSLTIMGTHWMLVLGILLVVVFGQSVLYYVLKAIFAHELDTVEHFILGLSGWILPASLLSVLWYAGGTNLSPLFWTIVLAAAAVGSALAGLTQRGTISINNPKRTLVYLALLAVIFIALRMVFVSRAVLPLYFDSAQHYLLTRGLLDGGTPFNGPAAGWYHLGFHFLTAFITYLTQAEISDVMLVLGQFILALMPFLLFQIVRHETRSTGAGTFALLLAAFGWYMPAHAVDWGKYPALAGIALIPFVLSLVHLWVEHKSRLSRARFRGLNALLMAGMLVSIFLHSRSLIVFALAALTWVITSAWRRLPQRMQLITLWFVIAALTSMILLIQADGTLGPLFDAYGNKGLVTTLAVLFLSMFAYRMYPRLVFFCLLAMLFFLATLFIPVTGLIPGYMNTSLLDRPFVQMILYFPLSLLGGFGLAALEQMLHERKMAWPASHSLTGRVIVVFFIMLVTVNALVTYDLHPSDCCDLASPDDLEAIRWMDKNIPADARILISSTELDVLPTDDYEGSAGGDAGTWITPLTRRVTVPLLFDVDFSDRQTLDALCGMDVDYVYVGGTGWNFDDAGMPVQPGAYSIVLALPEAKLYEVSGCQ